MSPRTPVQLAEIRQQSREKILSAALRLFAENGFHNTSVSKIAKEAGVAKGLMYNYFESKEALIHAMIEEEFAKGESIMAEMMSQPSAKAKLKWIFEYIYNSLQNQFDYTKLISMISLKLESFPEIQEMIRAKYRGYMPLLAALLAEMGYSNPEAEARLLAATLDGIAMQYLVLHESFSLRQIIDDLNDKYCS